MPSIDITEHPDCLCIGISGQLRIDDASASRSRLLEAIARGERVDIDLAGVTHIDAAGLQLLLLMKREAVRNGRQLALKNHSDAVVELFELYRVAGYFGDPLLLPAAMPGSAK